MRLLLKTIATQSYSSARIVACTDQSQFMLKFIETHSSCNSTAIATTAFASAAASKNYKRVERDNTTIHTDQGQATKNYQSYSRLALPTSAATTTTITDRPVFTLASYFGKELVKVKHLIRHNRFYCTRQSTKKKMASISNEKLTIYLQKRRKIY